MLYASDHLDGLAALVVFLGALLVEFVAVCLSAVGASPRSAWFRGVESSIAWMSAAVLVLLTVVVPALLVGGAAAAALHVWSSALTFFVFALVSMMQAWVFTSDALTASGRAPGRRIALGLDLLTALTVASTVIAIAWWSVDARDVETEHAVAIGIAAVSGVGAWGVTRTRRRRRVFTEVVAAADELLTWTLTERASSIDRGMAACLRLERAASTRLGLVGYRVADRTLRRALVVYAIRLGRGAAEVTSIAAASGFDRRLSDDLGVVPEGQVRDELRGFAASVRSDLGRWVDIGA